MSDILRHLFHPKFIHMTLFGFVAGIPYSLIFGSLSLWLGEVGVAKSSITLFSWAALGYSFKYLWSPLADQLPIPWLTQRMGQRRSWLLVAQILIMASILMMAMTNPANGDGALVQMALAATLLGFSAATQDISIDAWRIEAANEQDIAMLSSVYLASYRLGMITSSFGVLYLAGSLGTSTENYQYAAWQISYGLMAALIFDWGIHHILDQRAHPRHPRPGPIRQPRLFGHPQCVRARRAGFCLDLQRHQRTVEHLQNHLV